MGKAASLVARVTAATCLALTAGSGSADAQDGAAGAGWTVQDTAANLISVENGDGSAILIGCTPAPDDSGRALYTLLLVFPGAIYEDMQAAMTPDMLEAVQALGISVSIDHGDGPRGIGSGLVDTDVLPDLAVLQVAGFQGEFHSTFFLRLLTEVMQGAEDQVRMNIWSPTGTAGERVEHAFVFPAEGAPGAFETLSERCGPGLMQ